MNKLIEKASAQSTEMLKEIVMNLKDDHRDGADLVFQTAIDILETRLTETEFCAFCDSIY